MMKVSFILAAVLAVVSGAGDHMPHHSEPVTKQIVHKTSSASESAVTKNLQDYASATWKYFVQATNNPTHLPVDRIDVGNTIHDLQVNATTSPTDIGMYMMSVVSARDLGIISKAEANKRMQDIIYELGRMAKWHGFLYNWYSTVNGSVQSGQSAKFVSTVDDGWYAAGLVVARRAFPAYAVSLSRLLNSMDFSRLYDPSIGQMYGGYDPVQKALATWHYGNLNTESRVADYIAIGQGKVPATLWWSVYRTVPANWTWQLQTPVGRTVTHDGVQVFEGHYSLYGMQYVPSWGGSMFESLMPTLVLQEQSLGTKGLGLNDLRMVDLQIKYAQSKQYPVWGISPCALPNNGYGVYGVPGVGTTKYAENGTITPYATFLALNFRPHAAIANLQNLASKYSMLGPFGFYDSVNVHSSIVAHAYLALDQGMIMAALDNYLNHNRIQQDFNADPIGAKPRSLLAQENFFLH